MSSTQPPGHRPTLLDLVGRIARGGRAAFSTLYDETAPRLFGIAQRILQQRELAEDVVQDSFVTAWERAHEFDPVRGSVMSWLTAIVRHRAIDQLRHRAICSDAAAETDAVLQELVSAETERADRGADLAALQRCLDELDAQARKLVVMNYVYGFTHQELAAQLRSPMGTVKSRIRRSLERLQTCLEGWQAAQRRGAIGVAGATGATGAAVT